MFFILSKILFFFLQPIVWLFSFLLWSILTKSPKRRKKLIITSIAILFVFSNQFLFNEISKVWENKVISTVKPTDQYEVAIVLGGMSGFDDARNQQTFFANSERLLNVLPLYHEKKVKKILFAGGSGRLTNDKVEATAIRDYLIAIGVDPKDILIETKSRNTYENAKFSIAILKERDIEKTILLSTSATHMYRSKACFEKLGVKITPFPVDYISREENNLTLDFLLLPDPKTMNNWYWLLHEWIGILSYSLMGYC